MTVIRLSDPESEADRILAHAQAHYLEVLEDLEAVKLYLRDRDDLSEAEMKRVLGEYRRATQTLFDERKRIEDVRKKQKGIVHDYALDFDAIRDEIGRRLDRLRAEEDTGGAA